jgi:phosphatidylserine/phosphatidylglycerophosphate/cardiolipin synthase-like enzyme
VIVLKRILPIIILLLFVYAWYLLIFLPAHPKIKPIEIKQTNLSLFIEPEAGSAPIVNEINQAQNEIDVEVYLLSSKDIINSLEEAKSRGVQVNVILEEHPFGGSGLNPATKKDLENHGIKVTWSNPAFALTHEKSILIDNHEVFILTQNLTASSFTKNREYDVLDLEDSDIKEIKNIFASDWNRSSFFPSSTDLVISPNTSRSLLSSLISDAQHNIDIEVEDIADPAFTNLLIEKSKTVSVNLLLPSLKQVSSNQKDINILKGSNVHIKTITSPYLHAKLILEENKKAYLGSVNFSTQSMDENRELGIIINQSDILQKLEETFSADWQKGIVIQ